MVKIVQTDDFYLFDFVHNKFTKYDDFPNIFVIALTKKKGSEILKKIMQKFKNPNQIVNKQPIINYFHFFAFQ